MQYALLVWQVFVVAVLVGGAWLLWRKAAKPTATQFREIWQRFRGAPLIMKAVVVGVIGLFVAAGVVNIVERAQAGNWS
jgi:Na+/H+-dicarboxylate symporter